MRQTIEGIKQKITPKSILWAYPIALKLQEYHYSLAIQWTLECLQIYSSEFKPDNLSKLNKYIQQATEERDILTPLQCDEISREIWYLPGKDDFQTAISRLWWSIASFKDGEEQGGIREAVSVVELLLFETFNMHLLYQFLEAAVRIYEDYEVQK